MRKVASGDTMGSKRRIYYTINGLMQSWVCNDWGSWVGIPTLRGKIQHAFYFKPVLCLHFFVWFPHVSRIYQHTIVFFCIADLLLSHEVRKLSKPNFQNQKFPLLKSANKGFTVSQFIGFPICSKEYGRFHEMNTFQNLFLEEGSTCTWLGNKM